MKIERIERIGQATLYLGDSLELAHLLPAFQAVITDPPYGIQKTYASYEDSLENWKILMQALYDRYRPRAKITIFPCGQIKQLPWAYHHIPPDWTLIWHKGSTPHRAKIGFNYYEPHLVYGKPFKAMPDLFTIATYDEELFRPNRHPCPKPVRYAKWIIDHATGSDWIVCDPFMGSGTTGVAALQLGRGFIGVEIDPGYYQIACERIHATWKQLPLFKQEELEQHDLSFTCDNGEGEDSYD